MNRDSSQVNAGLAVVIWTTKHSKTASLDVVVQVVDELVDMVSYILGIPVSEAVRHNANLAIK